MNTYKRILSLMARARLVSAVACGLIVPLAASSSKAQQVISFQEPLQNPLSFKLKKTLLLFQWADSFIH